MNTIQYAGTILSSLGILVVIGWMIWKAAQIIELPTIVTAGLLLAGSGTGIVIASLIYERSKDVKKESFDKD